MLAHGLQNVEGPRDPAQQFEIGGEFHDAQRKVAHTLEFSDDAESGHDQAQVRGDRRFAAEQIVATLHQRNVHRVDAIVNRNGFGGNGEISRSQNLEHPFEVLIDDDSHHLDLYRELLQFRAEMLAERTALSRSGR
jgi:hypothetical protein